MNTHRQGARMSLSGISPLLLALWATTASAQALESEGWSYTGTFGPERWGELPGNGLCSTGQQQTPIPLWSLTTLPLDLSAPSFSYQFTPVNMRNTGSTVEFTYEPGSTIRSLGTNYRLAQFHFHTPSEHTLDAVSYPLELHLVHVDASGAPAVVVGMFIKRGAENQALATAFRNLPQNKGDVSQPLGAVINAENLLPRNRTHFMYPGSLTTPPCTEGIRWYVMRTPIEMSDAQIAAYQQLPQLNPSARPLQPVNGRVILKHLDLL
ncbi:MAG TPA: carbonic anhydrase family protein [Archangium sp.]|uniref:carbonic anhydrase n=1 Tax=Archangium sp. TaxID=1872627 RepID=UPI002E34366C|nr:carbonic anhydrase family protein [Archangium sp.]HEX5749332.1 carbonic anhydrase family protein [Archangium sp.]